MRYVKNNKKARTQAKKWGKTGLFGKDEGMARYEEGS